MRFAAFRSVLRRLVLVSLPVAGAAACTCVESEHRVQVRFTGPQNQALVERCRTSGDCEPLCQKVLTLREGWLPSYGAITHCEMHAPEDGYAVVHVKYMPECVGGRRPAGLAARRAEAPNPVGAWLADLARLEAASVPAFVQLVRELRAHGAPAGLWREARRAAADEVRHARLVGALARRYGAQPTRPEVARPAPRALEVVAEENAAEGCVRETYGALVALWQARTAVDPAVRAAMATIAEDETRHASLAWRVDRWSSRRLGAAARRRVHEARRAAAAELLAAAAAPVPPELRRLAGVPDASDATVLARRAADALWA